MIVSKGEKEQIEKATVMAKRTVERAVVPRIDPRDVAFLVMIHGGDANETDKIIWCKNREELDLLIETQSVKSDRPGGLRIFGVERDIEFAKQ